MHHKRVDKAGPGDNVGMNIKGLDKVRSECNASVLCCCCCAACPPAHCVHTVCLPRQHPFCTPCACRLRTQLPCSPCPTPLPSLTTGQHAPHRRCHDPQVGRHPEAGKQGCCCGAAQGGASSKARAGSLAFMLESRFFTTCKAQPHLLSPLPALTQPLPHPPLCSTTGEGLHRPDPDPGHPRRGQGGLLPHRLCALRPLRLPHHRHQLEGARQRLWWWWGGGWGACWQGSSSQSLVRSRLTALPRALQQSH